MVTVRGVRLWSKISGRFSLTHGGEKVGGCGRRGGGGEGLEVGPGRVRSRRDLRTDEYGRIAGPTSTWVVSP